MLKHPVASHTPAFAKPSPSEHTPSTMSLTTSAPLDRTLSTFMTGQTASGEPYNRFLFDWMTNMHTYLSHAPGVHVTGMSVSFGQGPESLGFEWKFGRGNEAQSTMPASRPGKRIEASQSRSGMTTDKSEAPKRIMPASSTAASEDKARPSASTAASKSKPGYTSDGSATSKAPKVKKRQSAPTISELPAAEASVTSAVTESGKNDLAATPAVTTTTSIQSTKPAKLELSKATDASLSELAATPAPITTTAPSAKPKTKKKVSFTSEGFTDRPEATFMTDIPNKREGKEDARWRYRDTLTSVDPQTASRLWRYAQSKRLKSYQALAQKTGVPLESASEFYKLASDPATSKDNLGKFELKRWEKPAGTTEIPYAYSTYASKFPHAGTTDAATSKDAGTSSKKPPQGEEFDAFLKQFVNAAKQHNMTREDFLTYDSAASIAGPNDTAALEALAKELGHSKADFDATRQAIYTGAPDTKWTEKEYTSVVSALPKAKAKATA